MGSRFDRSLAGFVARKPEPLAGQASEDSPVTRSVSRAATHAPSPYSLGRGDGRNSRSCDLAVEVLVLPDHLVLRAPGRGMQLWAAAVPRAIRRKCLDVVGLDQRGALVIEQLRQGTAISTSSSRLATAEAGLGTAAREAGLSGRDVGNLNEAMAAVMAARRLDDGADLAGRGRSSAGDEPGWACRWKSSPLSFATAPLCSAACGRPAVPRKAPAQLDAWPPRRGRAQARR